MQCHKDYEKNYQIKMELSREKKLLVLLDDNSNDICILDIYMVITDEKYFIGNYR